MSLYLKIDQDAATNFFTLYDPLGPLEKKIWNAAVWWVKKFPCAHPKQIKIADHVGCSRKHVNRALAKFKKYGWLYLTSRGAKRTKIIGIPAHLVCLDVVNREYFKRIEVTSKVTHSSSRFPNSTSRKTGGLDVPLDVQKMKISFENKLKLSMVSEKVRQDALESAKLDHGKGKILANIENYVAGTAIKMAQKRGERLNWPEFYRQLR